MSGIEYNDEHPEDNECDEYPVYMPKSESSHGEPYSIVWTALPGLTWVIPFIGHTGITEYSFH